MANEITGLSSLQICYDALIKYNEKTPLIKISDGFDRYSVKSSEDCYFSHEAGFDAFMTGYVFFKMLSLQSEYFICAGTL